MWKNAFKAYDIRGKVPSEINNDLVYKIAQSAVRLLGDVRSVVIGYDAREDSKEFAMTLKQSFMDAGCHVINLGLGGTEQVYFYTGHLDADLGMMVTASHNPKGYNGIKIVQKNAAPLDGDVSLEHLKQLTQDYQPQKGASAGSIEDLTDKSAYIEHLLGYIDVDQLKSMKIVVNAGNGGAGLVIDALEEYLPCEFIKIHHEPDGTFPHGIPNPLLPDNRHYTAEAVKKHDADFGIAWDGDYDRCFFFDHEGGFIEGYYIVGLLAQSLLKSNPKENIIYDPRLIWNSIDMINAAGGNPVVSLTGHALIKAKMREVNAPYGGEMSAHHYFRDFYYCDSGMIPWLLIYFLLSTQEANLKDLVEQAQNNYPCSGEINYTVDDAKAITQKIEEHFKASDDLVKIEHLDGLSMEFKDWRFNLRSSNTEPLLRLNVESRGDHALMEEKTILIEEMIR